MNEDTDTHSLVNSRLHPGLENTQISNQNLTDNTDNTRRVKNPVNGDMIR